MLITIAGLSNQCVYSTQLSRQYHPTTLRAAY